MSRILIAAAALLPLLAAPAFAAERDSQSVNVSLRGVHIGTATGDALLQARLRSAARQVCGSADARDLQAMADMKACRADAMTQAAPQLLAALAGARAAGRDTLIAANTPR